MWVNHMRNGFAKAKLEKLAELPQLHHVFIALRVYSYVQPILGGGAEQVPEPIKTWIVSAERRMLPGGESQKDP